MDEQEKQEGLGKNHFDKKHLVLFDFFTNLVFSIRIFNSIDKIMTIAIFETKCSNKKDSENDQIKIALSTYSS